MSAIRVAHSGRGSLARGVRPALPRQGWRTCVPRIALHRAMPQLRSRSVLCQAEMAMSGQVGCEGRTKHHHNHHHHHHHHHHPHGDQPHRLFSVYAPPSDPQAYIKYLIDTEPVLIFSHSWSLSCRQAKHILINSLGGGCDALAVVELDLLENGCEIEDLLAQICPQARAQASEAPSIWLGGQYIGGVEELEAMQGSGALARALAGGEEGSRGSGDDDHDDDDKMRESQAQ